MKTFFFWSIALVACGIERPCLAQSHETDVATIARPQLEAARRWGIFCDKIVLRTGDQPKYDCDKMRQTVELLSTNLVHNTYCVMALGPRLYSIQMVLEKRIQFVFEEQDLIAMPSTKECVSCHRDGVLNSILQEVDCEFAILPDGRVLIKCVSNNKASPIIERSLIPCFSMGVISRMAAARRRTPLVDSGTRTKPLTRWPAR